MDAAHPEAGLADQDLNPAYWEHAAAPFFQNGQANLWRLFCDELYRRLLRDWLDPAFRARRALKTDLFDEAAGPGLVNHLRDLAGQVHAIDLSAGVARVAGARNPEGCFVAADVRCLPYPSETFDLILSNSTLDHFRTRQELADSLIELKRILRPGGRLLISLDNHGNPLLMLRRNLPFQWLSQSGLVPYFVGESVTKAEFPRLLASCGYDCVRVGTFMPAPRVLAIPACRFLQGRGPAVARRSLAALLAFEILDGLPTRTLTAHYVAALAIKPG